MDKFKIGDNVKAINSDIRIFGCMTIVGVYHYGDTTSFGETYNGNEPLYRTVSGLYSKDFKPKKNTMAYLFQESRLEELN